MSKPNQKKVTVFETEYTLQHPGAYWYLECNDRNKVNGKGLQIAPYSKELIENVVVQPKVSFEEDFAYDVVTLGALVEEIENFLNTRPDKSSKAQKQA